MSGRYEYPDSTPVSLPIGLKRPTTLEERIRNIVRNEASLLAQSKGYESFEEADDFNVPDDPLDPKSQFELDFDQESLEAPAKDEKPANIEPAKDVKPAAELSTGK